MHWLILILIVIDQASKIIMNVFFKDISLELIENNILGMRVFLNTENLSVFNHEIFDFNLSLSLLILLNIVILAVLISIYFYFQKNQFSNRITSMIFILLIAGTISSTIDRVFWGGSLDFIVLLGYIVDLKDLYAVAGATIVAVYTLGIEFNMIKVDVSALSTKGYFQFIKNNLLKGLNID